MADIWIPGWERVDLGPNGGTYDSTLNPKACVHTTEGTTLAGAESAYRNYPPHLGYDPVRRVKRQYVALNRYSYAFRNGETDDEFIVQVEVVGFAAKTHTWPTAVYRNFAVDVVQPLHDLIGVPLQHLRFYRADEGIVLARKTSPIRLRPAALRSYSGWMGHQHAPGLADNGALLATGDEHWDPGGFLMDLAFSFVAPTKSKPPLITQEDEVPRIYYVKGNSTDKMPPPHEKDSYGDLVFLVEGDAEGLLRRHIQSDELRAAGVTPTVVSHAWLDAIPCPDGLFPWENAGGGPVSGEPK